MLLTVNVFLVNACSAQCCMCSGRYHVALAMVAIADNAAWSQHEHYPKAR